MTKIYQFSIRVKVTQNKAAFDLQGSCAWNNIFLCYFEAT